jgi:acyl-CoA synthetase (AMP-forming)/AMP-acid ligase II
LQKPVLLSHAAVLKHIDNYAEALQLNENDKIISWLPLYHDMGLIAAFHLPLAFGVTSVQLDPFEWVMIPSLLLEAISKEKGTLCWLPNFAFNLMADKIHEDELENISLDSMRLIINCSEPIREDSHNKFYSRFKKYGLRKNTISTCYAMAETTFAVTQAEPGIEPTVLLIDRKEAAQGKFKFVHCDEIGRRCVSSGKLINGCKIIIVDEQRNEAGSDFIGEIAIKSVSVFDGYRNYPEKTREVLSDNWYYSGDYGFKYNDEYFIIGRKKDIIIVAGNNVYPEDIEDSLIKLKGIIPGRVVAFGELDEELGSEQISIIAETNLPEFDHKELKKNILKTGMEIDVNIKQIYLVPPKWLIKCSAGKPSRKINSERIKKLAGI